MTFWTPEIMKRAQSEFPCIECCFDKPRDYEMFFHKGNCLHGRGLTSKELSRRLGVWEEWMKEILEDESIQEAIPKKCEYCNGQADGTMYILYHEDGVGRGKLLTFHSVCMVHSKLNDCEDWDIGRDGGFIPSMFFEKWEFDLLEDIVI